MTDREDVSRLKTRTQHRQLDGPRPHCLSVVLSYMQPETATLPCVHYRQTHPQTHHVSWHSLTCSHLIVRACRELYAHHRPRVLSLAFRSMRVRRTAGSRGAWGRAQGKGGLPGMFPVSPEGCERVTLQIYRGIHCLCKRGSLIKVRKRSHVPSLNQPMGSMYTGTYVGLQAHSLLNTATQNPPGCPASGYAGPKRPVFGSIPSDPCQRIRSSQQACDKR